MGTFDSLLDLQATDTRGDQVRHRLATLPERAAVEANEAELAALEADRAAVQQERDGLSREQRRFEDELAAIEAKVAEVNDQLYGQGLTSPKQAQVLQEELGSLARRQSDLEDQVIERLERAEPLEAELDRLGDRRQELDARGSELLAALAEAESALAGELDELEAARVGLAEAVPADLMSTYERLRVQLGGVAVARLQGGSCGGCHLQLAAAELDRLRHLSEDELATCEECGRLIVH